SLCLLPLFLSCSLPLPDFHSFPTRRSSDLSLLFGGLFGCFGLFFALFVLGGLFTARDGDRGDGVLFVGLDLDAGGHLQVADAQQDRKSTRLNSSHVSISYAVFCLKKKTNIQ